jgi:hypothetical protein
LALEAEARATIRFETPRSKQMQIDFNPPGSAGAAAAMVRRSPDKRRAKSD